MDGFVLNRGQFADVSMSSALVGWVVPVDDCQTQLVPGTYASAVSTFFWRLVKKLSIAALAREAPAGPVDSITLWCFNACWNFSGRNSLPHSLGMISPAIATDPLQRAAAPTSAATASRDSFRLPVV